jgi:8-hydroxy-5-deazaflavin:NADPH oxidoreductase
MLPERRGTHVRAIRQFIAVQRLNEVLLQPGDGLTQPAGSAIRRWPGLAIAHTSSSAEALAKKARKAAVVSAFGTVPSEVLFDVFDAKRRSRRWPSLLYCGGDHDAKNVAARLIRDVGFEAVDAGPLRMARYREPYTLAMAQLAYEGDTGLEIAYRIERFGK